MQSYTHEHFTIHQLEALCDNYIYLIEYDDRLICIDPGEATPVLRACRQLGKPPTAMVITHHQRDHCAGLPDLVSHFACPIYCSAFNLPRIAGATAALGNIGQILPDGCAGELFDLPGHTDGHIGLRIDDALFSGDIIFGAGCGKTFEGSEQQLWQSIQQLAALDSATRIYCAHEYAEYNLPFARWLEPESLPLQEYAGRVARLRQDNLPAVPLLLAEELACNPFLRPLDGDFCRMVAARFGCSADSETVFTQLRRARDVFRAG